MTVCEILEELEAMSWKATRKLTLVVIMYPANGFIVDVIGVLVAERTPIAPSIIDPRFPSPILEL